MSTRRAAEDRRRRPAPQRRPVLSPGARIAIGAVVALIVLVLLVRGCGDGSLSADELRSQAGEICASANAVTDRVAVPNAPSGGERFLREGLAQLRPASARLAALKAPEQLRDRYERAVALTRQEVRLIDDTTRAIAGGEDVIDAFAALQAQLAPVLNEANAAWRTLEIPACVRR
ncbi:hypothetical protein [Conexibacter arvalis]|uniref:Uncharacterized protein n=1 Tax=Conexibacter arvalis TaxID=912552 RepID=A0A840IGU4_9ACTN|nr:hypothetical protein [Conexibacter arvalis]MBB4663178.1 hypothetical protein [Conexibacter arvalis]